MIMDKKPVPRVLIVYCNTPMEPLVPLGVACLATSLEENGIDVRIFDNTLYEAIEDNEEHPELDFDDDGDSQKSRAMSQQVKEVNFSSVGLVKSKNNMVDDFKKIIEEFKPNLIGLSCVELTLLTGLKLLESIKNKKIFNIVGGCVATFASEKVLSYEVTNSVCIGEGEKTIVELARSLVNGDSLDNIPNFAYKKGKNKIHRSTNNFLIPTKNFDIPKFHLFQKERIWRPMDGKFYRMIPIEFSRGCPYKCTYCSAPSYNDKFADIGRWKRHKTMNQIMTEIEYNMKDLM
jgi:Fe-S oxidoreductase